MVAGLFKLQYLAFSRLISSLAAARAGITSLMSSIRLATEVPTRTLSMHLLHSTLCNNGIFVAGPPWPAAVHPSIRSQRRTKCVSHTWRVSAFDCTLVLSTSHRKWFGALVFAPLDVDGGCEDETYQW